MPQDAQLPILRFPFRSMTLAPRAECFVTYAPDGSVSRRYIEASVESMYVTFETASVIEMKTRGVDHPYVHRRTNAASGTRSRLHGDADTAPAKYIFTLLYTRLDVFLATVHIIYRVAKRARRSSTDEAHLLAPVLVPRRATGAFDASLLVDFREKLLLDAPERVDRIEPLVKYPGCLMLSTERCVQWLYTQSSVLWSTIAN